MLQPLRRRRRRRYHTRSRVLLVVSRLSHSSISITPDHYNVCIQKVGDPKSRDDCHGQQVVLVYPSSAEQSSIKLHAPRGMLTQAFCIRIINLSHIWAPAREGGDDRDCNPPRRRHVCSLIQRHCSRSTCTCTRYLSNESGA
jgi:hypothetical protein